MTPEGLRRQSFGRSGRVRPSLIDPAGATDEKAPTSTADINDVGRGHTPATPAGRRAGRRQQSGHARTELLKRVSQVRILPGAQKKGPAQEGFLPDWPFFVFGHVLAVRALDAARVAPDYLVFHGRVHQGAQQLVRLDHRRLTDAGHEELAASTAHPGRRHVGHAPGPEGGQDVQPHHRLVPLTGEVGEFPVPQPRGGVLLEVSPRRHPGPAEDRARCPIRCASRRLGRRSWSCTSSPPGAVAPSPLTGP